jgi:tetratricopeptide (TPR) repeat protein
MKLLLLFVFTAALMAFEPSKQAVVDFEMGNYFFKGQDMDHALEYFNKAKGKLPEPEMEYVVARSLGQIYLLKEDKKSALKVFEDSIKTADMELLKTSEALRDVFALYAQIKADAINPNIFNAIVQQRIMQRKKMMERQGASAPKEGPKLGF